MAFFNIGKSEKKQHSTSKRELRILSDSTSFGFKEAYRALRTNLNYVIESGHVGHVIMVTSSVPSEAKSNVSVNLCISYSQEHKKVLLVDCDLRKGTLHRYLGVSRRQDGIVEYLNNTVKDWRNCIVHLNEYGIDFMPSGMIVDNTTELLGGSKTGYLFNELLEATNANILGVVLSMYDAKKTGTDNTHQYSYYNYNYNYGSNYGYGSDSSEQDRHQ